MLHFEGWKKALIILACLTGVVFAMPNLFYETADTAAQARGDIEAERYVESNALTAEEFAEVRAVWPEWASDRTVRRLPTLEDLEARAAEWPSYLPPGVVNLGLDLRGGAHLLIEVQVMDLVTERMANIAESEIRDALRDAGITRYTGISASTDNAVVRITNAGDLEAAEEALEGLAVQVGSFITGTAGPDLEVNQLGDQVLEVRFTDNGLRDLTDRTMATTLEIVRNRIDEAGTREPTIQREGEDRILVQVPGIGSADELKELLGTTAKLSFHVVLRESGAQSAGPGELELPHQQGGTMIVERRPLLSGENLVDASLGFHHETGVPVVNFRFDSRGAQIFGDFTLANAGTGNPFAIVLDGEIISAPGVDTPILGGAGFIHGAFTVDSADRLAILLRSGALPADIKILQESTVGPDLGADSVAAGSMATMIAFAAVLVFMMAAYGRFGIFASIALLVNVALIFGVLSAIGATLTLPGIAGIVLTIGMAVDANVLIFERIREELRSARGPARAIERGYEQALSSIVDANITTLIAAVILFAMGSGPVKGFAVTLGIGIVTSVFTAVMVTRLMVATWFHRARPKKFAIGGFRMVPDETRVPFMSFRKVAVLVSGIAVAASIGLTAVNGLNFGIDFRGGTLVEVRTEAQADLGQIRGIVGGMELGDVAVQSFGSERDVLVRVEEQVETAEGAPSVADLVGAALTEAIPGTEIRRTEVVGPKVSGELLTAGIMALALAIAAILLYIWLRFEWQFGVGAVAALAHDVVITVGIFSLMGIEFNLAIIAALLTIIGYSLNDTVVVFDRVRENLRKYKKMELSELLDLSLNGTLARTLMTSVTTLIALIAMFGLGPEVIKGFTFAMIWGILIGTYSSIFVAAVLLLALGVKRDWTTPGETKQVAGVNFGAQV